MRTKRAAAEPSPRRAEPARRSGAFLDFRIPGEALRAQEVEDRVCARVRLSQRALRRLRGRLEAELRAGRVPAGTRVRLPLESGAEEESAEQTLAGPVVVLTPAPPWQRGELEVAAGARSGSGSSPQSRSSRGLLPFEVEAEHRGIARLWMDATGFSRRELRAGLGRAGFPVLGDARNGGVLVQTALCMASPGGGPDWPDEPAFPAGAPAADARLAVSAASARALAQGHPWVLRDEETGDAGRFRPGTLVLAETRGARGTRNVGLVRVEGEGKLVARLWSKASSGPSVEARVDTALARRRALAAASSPTDAYRLIHGECDGLPGIAVDRLGPLLRCLIVGGAAEGFRRALVGLLAEAHDAPGIGRPPVLEVLRLRDAPAGQLEGVRMSGSGSVPTWLEVRERALRFWVVPGLHDPLHPTPGSGLYLDQRENRARLAKHARRGGRWLNLFAHTGAFSVALLAAGAEEVSSVDLSARYLRWAEANLALNRDAGVDPQRHRSVRSEGRRFLERLDPSERFAGVILDPPTAAASGRRFWSVARDLEPMIERAISHLAPGGVLFVCRNDRRASSPEELVVGAARRSGRSLETLIDAPPGPDFPRSKAFPEGQSFHGVIARVR